MNSWENIIKEESKKEYFQRLQEKLEMERRSYEVYPLQMLQYVRNLVSP